jgi:hypothetical protein
MGMLSTARRNVEAREQAEQKVGLPEADKPAIEELQPDNEIEAIEKAHAALVRLPRDGQWRAVQYIINRLGLLKESKGDSNAAG